MPPAKVHAGVKFTHVVPAETEADLEEGFLHGTFWILPLLDAWHSQVFEEDRPFIVEILKAYLLDFERTNILGLEWDRRTRRAYHQGVPHDEIPVYTEHGRCVRRLRKALENIARAKNAHSFIQRLRHFIMQLRVPLKNAFSRHIELTPAYETISDKDRLLMMAAAFRIADVAERGLEQFLTWGWWAFHKDPTPEDRFERSTRITIAALRLLHGLNPDLAETLDLSGKPQDAMRALRKASRHAIAPITEKVGTTIFFDPVFQRTGDCKAEFAALTRPTQDPPRVNLDQAFMWYPVEALSNSRMRIFCGAAAFIPLLMGEVDLQRRHGSKHRLHVLRLRHPEATDWYSYACLVERHGTLKTSASIR